MKKIGLQPLLPTHYSQVSLDYKPLPTDSHEYSFDFTGPNGHWEEELRLRLVHGKWVQAFRVVRDVPDPNGFFFQHEELLTDVDPEFPQPVDWTERM